MQMANLVSCSKIICTHSWDNPAPIASFGPHKGNINCVVWNHTNKALASCSNDGRIVIVSTEKPDQVAFEVPFDPTKTISVNSCAFSSNSKYIAAGGADSLVKYWDMKGQNKQLPIILRSHFGSVTSVAWSRYDDIIASSSSIGDVFLNSVKNNNVVENFASKGQEHINMIRFSQGQNHNRLGACTNNGSVLVWDVTTRSLMCNFKNTHKSPTNALSFSSFNPVLLVACSSDQNMYFYDISQKKEVKSIPAEQSLTSVSFHSDGHTLVAGGSYGGLYIYDLRKPNMPKERLLGHESAVKYVDFSKEKDDKATVKYTSVLSTNKNSTNTQMRKQTGISTIPVLNEKPVVTPATTSTDKYRSISKIEPSQQTTSQVKHSHSIPPVIEHNTSTTTYNNFVKTEEKTGGDFVSKEAFAQFQRKLRGQLNQNFELLHLQIIRQFQIQQKEMQLMIENMMQQDRRKDQYIKKLQIQNQKLKKTSY